MPFPSFPAFYRALHDREPFPWQQALAERVAACGWPGTVDVPTGLGKTTTMTIAVWDLARQVHAGGVRTAPLRIVHIVDRTTLVDQTHEDLRQLHEALIEAAETGSDTPVGAVADPLQTAFGTPLVVGHAHGSDRDDGWISSAAVPVVVTMTAHQAVSRLLFRGFGVSARMSPVHAGLLGVDSLLLLDEPHLSTAALATLSSVVAWQRTACALPVPHARVVAVGATVPREGTGEVFRISAADYQHPVAGQRLAAAKSLEVVTADSAGDGAVRQALIKAARDELRDHPDRSVAVVCNTVELARSVHAELAKKVTDDALLVTSRVRAHERARMNDRLAGSELPRLIVATQTVEAGVDLSVPTLITEVSEWSSLVQRLGRANRYGTTTGRVVLITTPAKTTTSDETPRQTTRSATEAIYGAAATGMAALAAQLPNGTDVSPVGLQQIRDQHAELVEQACTPHPPAPTVTAEMLSTLSHTNPRPAADVDVQPFITGVPERRTVEDVTVLWRDLPAPQVLEDQPPEPEELVSLPLAAVQHLLQQRLAPQSKQGTPPAVGDAASAGLAGDSGWSDDSARVAVYTGRQWRTADDHTDLTPGCWVVLDTQLGGHDANGWNPNATEPVLDLSAYYRHTRRNGRPTRRKWWLLTGASLRALWTLGFLTEAPDETVPSTLAEADPDERDELADTLLPVELQPLQLGPSHEHGLWVRAHPDEPEAEHLVTLDDHARHVAAQAAHTAEILALPQTLTATLVWAGYRHDDGKSFDRFQALLGADPNGPLLAKPHPHRPGLDGILPLGWRHEAASARQLVDDGASPLLVHLVAAHHGWARPLLPAAHGPDQALPTADRFAALTAEWGPWGLAWAEALLRLADHQASQAPETGHTAPTMPMPRHQPPAPTGQHRHEHALTGIPADTHLHWWAAFGALAAATSLDPTATLRFDPHPTGPVPVLATTTDLHTVAEQVVALRASVDQITETHPELKKKYEKIPACHVRHTLSTLDQQPAFDRATAAALLDDTQIPDRTGTVEPRVPWRHGNASLIKHVLNQAATPEHITRALCADEPDQHDDAKMFGLLPDGIDPAPATGIAHSGRSVLLNLVLAATTRLPSTGSSRPAGTTADRRRALPMPHHPASHDEFVALLQTLPRLSHRPWHDCGITVSTWRERPAHGRSFGWTEE